MILWLFWVHPLPFGVHYHDLPAINKPKYTSETLVPSGIPFRVGEAKDGWTTLKEIKK